MRVLQVVSVVDDDATCAGRLAVALNQSTELRRRGHDVLLVAAWVGVGEPPAELEGVPAQLFRVPALGSARARRSAGRFSLAMTTWLRRNADGFDVAHLHFDRDLVQIGVAAALDRAGVPYVVQTHGTVRALDGRPARWVDEVLAVPALRRAAQRLVADPAERQTIASLTGSPLGVTQLQHGIALPEPRHPLATGAGSGTLDVLFSGRVGAARGAMDFAYLAAAALEKGVDARFGVLGPDAGELAALLTFVREHPQLHGRLRYEGAVSHDQALARLRRADLFVLPAQDGALSMAVLEALAHGVPTVCTTGYSHAITLRARRAAKVVKPTPQALAQAVADLAADPAARQELGRRGRVAAERAFDIAVVVDELEAVYESAAERRRRTVPVPVPVPATVPQPVAEPVAQSVAETVAEPVAQPVADVEQHGGLFDDAQTLLWVATEVTPYRVALWREVAQLSSLTVALLAPTDVNWRFQLTSADEPFEVVQLNAPVAREEHGVPLHAATAALRSLVRRRPDAVVLDGWESPAFHKAARWARRLGIPAVATYRPARAERGDADGDLARRERGQRALRRRVDVVMPQLPEPAFFAHPQPALPRQAGPTQEQVLDLRAGHRFVVAGDLVGRKNVEALLRAFARMRGTGDTLTVAGTGPLAARLEALAGTLGLEGSVVFEPAADDASRRAAVLRGQTLVLPSSDEIWSHTVGTALGAGLHAVVSTACGIAEEVRLHPCAFTAEPTVDGLARAMQLSRSRWTARMRAVSTPGETAGPATGSQVPGGLGLVPGQGAPGSVPRTIVLPDTVSASTSHRP